MAKKQIRLRLHDIILRAVEDGVASGVSKAFKYSNPPGINFFLCESLEEHVGREVMNSLDEVINCGKGKS